VPSHKSEALEEYQFKETGPFRLANIIVTLTLGWPMYLFFNASGRKYERFANHFDPYSPIYSKRERLEIVVSDAALIAAVGGLTGLAQSFGWLWLLKVGGCLALWGLQVKGVTGEGWGGELWNGYTWCFDSNRRADKMMTVGRLSRGGK